MISAALPLFLQSIFNGNDRVEMGDSNSRPDGLKVVYIIPVDDLCCFPAISTRLRILFEALISTVSADSAPVCSQTCGQKTLSEHPRFEESESVFLELIGVRWTAVWRSALSHCTSTAVLMQVISATAVGQILHRYRQRIPSRICLLEIELTLRNSRHKIIL